MCVAVRARARPRDITTRCPSACVHTCSGMRVRVRAQRLLLPQMRVAMRVRACACLQRTCVRMQAQTREGARGMDSAGEGAALAAGVAGVVTAAVERTGAAGVVLEARGFLVAWGGVLALAFADWPPLLLAIKAALNALADQALNPKPDVMLAPENPGSRWPKITIGALQPDAQLSLEDLRALRSLCEKSAEEMEGLVWNVSELQVATFTSRSLAQRTEVPIPLTSPGGAHCAAPPGCVPCAAAPPGDGAVRSANGSSSGLVEEVMQEWERGDLEQYLSRVNTGANVLHYTQRCPPDHTLVALLLSQGSGGDAILRAVQRFASAVEARLPGKFHFFSDSCPSSLHLTVRTLRRQAD